MGRRETRPGAAVPAGRSGGDRRAVEGVAGAEAFARRWDHRVNGRNVNHSPAVRTAVSEPLVLIPGLGCTGRLFGPQAPVLGRHAVAIADHRSDETMEAIVERLLATAPPRFGLIGLSMGGYVALETQRRAPDRVTRLALLDTSARADTGETRVNRARLIALAEVGRLEDVHRALWPRLVHPDRTGDAELEGVVSAMLRETGAPAFARQQRAILSRRDQRDHCPSIEIPTLVLVGADDLITPPDLAREMAEAIEWASLVVVPGCGHLSTLEQPDAVNEALSRWLQA
jgi:pimeloyl-ACP methyl ester carboxylesterase